MIWNNADKKIYTWANNFNDIFINQKKQSIEEIFDKDNFGIHNSLTLDEYTEYELKEFFEKSARFGLSSEGSIKCFELGNDFFYFALGKKEDAVVFESIFKWNEKTNKAIGNQYSFKIEPKMGFVLDLKNNNKSSYRRFNLKSKNRLDLYKIIQKKLGENVFLAKIDLEDHLGGEFHYFSYNIIDDNLNTYWDDIKIYSSIGTFNHKILMRGVDHPFFTPDLFPIVSNNKKSFNIKKESSPVIIYVKTLTNDYYYKYPTEKEWNFNEEIKEICFTDNLSFDWIVKV